MAIYKRTMDELHKISKDKQSFPASIDDHTDNHMSQIIAGDDQIKMTQTMPTPINEQAEESREGGITTPDESDHKPDEGERE